MKCHAIKVWKVVEQNVLFLAWLAKKYFCRQIFWLREVTQITEVSQAKDNLEI